MQARIKKIIRILAWAILISFLAYTSISFTSNFLGLSEYMPIFTAHVPTPSMFPSIDQGDVIFVDTQMEFVDVMLNDIVVFDAPVGMTVHRIIGFGNDTLITQGDNNPNPDGLPVTEQTYVGSVIFVLENGSHYAVLILGCILGLFAHNTWLKVKRKRNTHTIADKGKSRNLKSRFGAGIVIIVAGYVIPIFILFVLNSTNILLLIGASFLIILFTVLFIIVIINAKSEESDRIQHWLGKPSTLGIIIICIGSIAVATFLEDSDPNPESDLLLINTVQSVTITVSTGTILLLIAMWFSYNDMQKLHARLDRIDEGLFDIHKDKDGNKTYANKLDKCN